MACSKDAICDITDETISTLQEKHPPSHPESKVLLPPVWSPSLPLISEEERFSELFVPIPGGQLVDLMVFGHSIYWIFD